MNSTCWDAGDLVAGGRECTAKEDKDVEDCVLRILTDAALSLPSDSRLICRSVSSQIGYHVSHTVVSNLLQKFAAQELIR